MEIVEEIKNGMRNLYDPMEIEYFFLGLDEGAHMAIHPDGPTVHYVYRDDLRIETTLFNSFYKNEGWISVYREEDLLETIPFKYEADESDDNE